MTEKKQKQAHPIKAAINMLRLPALLGGRSVVTSRLPSEPEVIAIQPQPSGMVLPTRATKTRPSFYKISFVAAVLIPAFLAAIYLIFLASDQYHAEARFAVRKAQTIVMSEDKSAGGSSSGGGNIGKGLADQDAHIIANYLRSRAAIEEIEKDINIIEIFQRPEADFWARLKKNPSKEEVVAYWNKMIGTYVDGPSGVVSVSAIAFRPDDAMRLVNAFIVVSERLANRLSERARNDAILKGEVEVRRTETQVRQALMDLRKYRDEEGLITPLMEATSTSKLLSETLSERIKLQNEYFVAVRALSPEAPSLRGLKSRLEGIDVEIEKLKGQLTNRTNESRPVSAAIVRFEELEIKRVFAEKMYSMSQDALQRARLRAEQQAIYISVFVPAHLPQEARFPERYSMSFLIAFGLLLCWGVGALLVAAVEDHTL